MTHRVMAHRPVASRMLHRTFFATASPDIPAVSSRLARPRRPGHGANENAGRGKTHEDHTYTRRAAGGAAALTYNFVGVNRDKDGKVSPNKAKSTRVYSKIDGKWMLVHANFAPAD
jgi:hypothetical protein